MKTIVSLADRMSQLKTLKSESLQAAKSHGHQMSNFSYADESAHVCRAECSICGAFLDIVPSPHQGEAETSGTAFDLSCPI